MAVATVDETAGSASGPAPTSVVRGPVGDLVTAGPTARRRLARLRRAKLAAVGLTLVAAAGVVGWQTPYLVERLSRPSYLGADAAAVAEALDCTQYQRSTNQDKSVYKYHDQGTCLLDGVRVTVTTFDTAAEGEAFLTLMNGLIPVVHPTWVGAATAAGDGWNVADTKNLSPRVAETAVRRLGAGEVRVIPSGKRS